MEMRPGRVACVADETYGLTRAQHRSLNDLRVEIRKMAIGPFLPIACPQGQPDPTVRIRLCPRLEHDAVGKGVERRAFGGRDVSGRIVVVMVRDRDDRGAAADRKHVARIVGHR